MEDYEEEEPGHRHISHLFALYPGDAFTTERTPNLAEAARTTLTRRLSSGGVIPAGVGPGSSISGPDSRTGCSHTTT